MRHPLACVLLGLICLLQLPIADSAEGSQDTQVGPVPLKDILGSVANNISTSPFDFSRSDRRIYRRRGYRGRRYRPRYRPRYYDDDDDYYYSEDMYDDWRPSSRRREYVDPCTLRRTRGNCNDSQERWYYNNRRGDCRRFTYSGCGGNRNNFISLKNCEDYCAGGFRSNKGKDDDEDIVELPTKP